MLHHASFTPFVVSVHGPLEHEALMLVHCLTDRMSSGWDKSYGHVLAWMKVC